MARPKLKVKVYIPRKPAILALFDNIAAFLDWLTKKFK